jgi:dipeptidyl-peptidase-4
MPHPAKKGKLNDVSDLSRLARRPAAALVVLSTLLCVVPDGAGQIRPLTIDDLYDPDKRIDATGPVVRDPVWIDDESFVWPHRLDATSWEWRKFEARRGTARPFIDADRLAAVLQTIPGLGAEKAGTLARSRQFVFNDSMAAMVLTAADDLFLYELASETLVRLTSDPGVEQEPAFSPDGSMVAFTRGHNLYVVDLRTHRERALTTDGGADVLNGRLDWVYQEEIYGRGRYRAFWWSPDSSRLAFLRLDERPVPEFTVVDHLPPRQALETTDYPKAGDANPLVRLGVVGAGGGAVTWIDDEQYSASEVLVVRVSWSRDGTRVVYQIQDREQTWLDLNTGDPATGSMKTLLRETTPAWVEPHGNPYWLEDGTFLWLSDRDGWLHLYHHGANGALLRRVTTGTWEVRTVYGVEDATGWVYFASTERSPIGRDLYRARLDGSGLTRLSGPPGTHEAWFSPSFRYYVGVWSDVSTPPQSRLHRADGSELSLIEANPLPALAGFSLVTPEFVQVTTRDGFVMEAMLIKPSEFSPSRRYPVYQHTYGGPRAPEVVNKWDGTTYLFHQLLAQHGIAVWICDNRSASGKGAVSAWAAYKRLGETELADIEDGLTWLKQQSWVDPTRIGLSGWSYGGFLVSYALTHSSSFVMGIAGGPVTDWRDYDSIYTERHMLMPRRNPDGYERSSPRRAADQLQGRLLLLHGTVDDNVHMQGTLRFAHALQKAGKLFELMLYPTQRHAVSDPPLVKHIRSLMLDFVLRTLRPSATNGS